VFTYANVGCLKVNLFQRPQILYIPKYKRIIFPPSLSEKRGLPILLY
jgi:hypothetical protein